MVLPRTRALLLTALSGVVLLAPGLVFAQAAGANPFTLSVSPQSPAPYSQATVTPGSTTLDLSNATFVVSVGGTEIYRGNPKPVVVTLGAAGTITNIRGTLLSQGTSYSQTLSLQPEEVSLIVEPLSSAPPLYAGKPLIPLEGNVRIVAVANLRTSSGTQIDPATLSYAWTVDGSEISSASGIGKSVLVAAVPLQYRESDVSVVVESQDGSLVGGDALALDGQEPALRIYANDPLLGILFDHALSGSYTLTGTEASFYGAPYSFSGTPSLTWFLNGTSADTGSSITLRPTGSGQGSASVSLVASSGNDTSASENLSLLFGGGTGTNLFGL